MARRDASSVADSSVADSSVGTRRNALGKTQEQLADDCGVHWTFIGQVERGRRNIALHNILKIAAGLQIDPAELVRGLQAPAE